MGPTRLRPRTLARFPLGWSEAGAFLAAYVVLCGVGIGVGMLIVHPWRHSWLQHTDTSIERWLAGHRTPWLNTATSIGSELANTMVTIEVTLIVAVAMLAVWRRWLEPLMVALALALEAAAFLTITWTVGRPRPAVPRLEGSPVGSSFPSGHVAAAVVYGGIVVVVFWRTRRPWIRIVSLALVVLLACFVGFSRLYRGMNNLSDVVAGALLGLASVLVTRSILLRSTAGRPDEEPLTKEARPCS